MFNLEKYFDRIGLQGEVPLTREGLERIHDAQLRSIPFENFDVLLNREIDVTPEGVYTRLVTNGRGGYCFQCNTLFKEALNALGFNARILLGRVIFANPDWTPPRLHALVLIELDGCQYIADTGFGAHTPRRPILLEDGVETSAIGRTWRVTRDEEYGWRLTDKTPDGWRNLYVFDLVPTYPMDVHVCNHWTATSPTSPFVSNALVVRHTEGGRVSLLGNRLAYHNGDAPRTCNLESLGEFRRVLAEEICIPLQLGDAEWDALWLKIKPSPINVEW